MRVTIGILHLVTTILTITISKTAAQGDGDGEDGDGDGAIQCHDSTFKFRVDINGSNKKRTCTWAEEDPITNCAYDGVDTMCRATCNTCEEEACTDTALMWRFGNGQMKWLTCAWVTEVVGTNRCTIDGVVDTCRASCEVCDAKADSFAPSLAESAVPSITASSSPSVQESDFPSGGSEDSDQDQDGDGDGADNEDECVETNGAKFFYGYKRDDEGNILEAMKKNCKWLKKKKNKGKKKWKKVCKRKNGCEEFEPAKVMCPVTCETCDE